MTNPKHNKLETVQQDKREMVHTPTPWKVAGQLEPQDFGVVITSPGNRSIAITTGRAESNLLLQNQVNAAFIVRVVNSHDALVTALTAMSGRFLSLIKFNSELGSERGREFLQIINDAHKALALAGVQEYTIRPEPLL